MTSPRQRCALLISTRSLGSPVTGRVVSLRTAVASLTDLGYRVIVAAFGAVDHEGAARAAGAVSVHQLTGPGPLRVLTHLVTRRSWTLNEMSWWHPAALKELERIAGSHEVDLVVADGIRMTPYAERLGLPWFVDLDDLLSDRYEAWAGQGLRLGRILGFRRNDRARVSAVLDRVPAAGVLRFESARMTTREVQIARRASGVSLVSAAEAERLSRRADREVRSLPMSISVSGRRTWTGTGSNDRRFAYAGSLTWWPNLAAVRWWVEVLAPGLSRRGLSGYTLHVFGEVPAGVRQELSRYDTVVLEGLRSPGDLHRELATFPYLLVPQQQAMGLTTKILEAAMLGMIVLTTRAAADGMAVTDRRELLLWDEVDELAEQIRWLRERTSPELAAIAARAQAWAQDNFAPEAVTRSWRAALDQLDLPPRAVAR